MRWRAHNDIWLIVYHAKMPLMVCSGLQGRATTQENKGSLKELQKYHTDKLWLAGATMAHTHTHTHMHLDIQTLTH